ncbi:MAG: NAD-dependent epimerase/dehydratase family protein [Nitrososphaerales archaeon]
MFRNTLITGSSGFVGKNLSWGFGFKSSDYDLKSYEQTQRLFANGMDSVVHCAARVGGLGQHLTQKDSHFTQNLKININVLECAKNAGVERVLSFGSSCAFPESPPRDEHWNTFPFTEDDLHAGEPSPHHYPYAFSKRMLQVQSRIYYEEFGLKYNVILPCNLYGGRWDSFSLEHGHVIGSLIHRCFLAQRDNTDFCIWGDGTARRQFVYADDINLITFWALQHYLDKEPLIIAPPESHTIKEVGYMIVDAFKFKGRVVFQEDKPQGQKVRLLSPEKFLSLKKHVFMPLDKGIANTVDQFLTHYPNLRL